MNSSLPNQIMRRITSPTSCPHCRCQQSQRIEVLAYTNLTRRNKHYQQPNWFIVTGYNLLLSHRLQASHCQRCLPSPSDLSTNYHPLIPRQMLHELLLCLCTQAIIVWQLIVVLDPYFRVSYAPAASPDYYVVTTLQDCIGLLVIIRGFCLVDIFLDTTLSILCHDSLLEGFPLAL